MEQDQAEIAQRPAKPYNTSTPYDARRKKFLESEILGSVEIEEPEFALIKQAFCDGSGCLDSFRGE
jgi:hypothetical protein